MAGQVCAAKLPAACPACGSDGANIKWQPRGLDFFLSKNKKTRSLGQQLAAGERAKLKFCAPFRSLARSLRPPLVLDSPADLRLPR